MPLLRPDSAPTLFLPVTLAPGRPRSAHHAAVADAVEQADQVVGAPVDVEVGDHPNPLPSNTPVVDCLVVGAQVADGQPARRRSPTGSR